MNPFSGADDHLRHIRNRGNGARELTCDALAFYRWLREANRALHCDFFEDVVMKRADSSYPVQLKSAMDEFRGWGKHRFYADSNARG
jgi:hypothetical protein